MYAESDRGKAVRLLLRVDTLYAIVKAGVMDDGGRQRVGQTGPWDSSAQQGRCFALRHNIG